MTALHTHRISMKPGSTDGGGNNYSFCYPKYRSATTLVSSNGEGRTIAWSSGQLYEARKLWVLWEFKPVTGRVPGRLCNFHNHPQFGGWLIDGPNGVSALAFDWFGDFGYTGTEGDGTGTPLTGLLMALEHNGANGRKRWKLQTVAEMDAAIAAGTWLSFVLEIDIHDTNGRVRAWANGASTPRFDTGTAKTCWAGQTGYAFWAGIYNSSGVPAEHFYDGVPPRVGRTLTEALNDGVTGAITEYTIDGGTLTSNGQAAWTHTILTSRDTSAFPLPPSLGGGTPPAVPANTALPTISGTAVQGQTLQASLGTWTNTPTSYAYQWTRCNSAGTSCSDIGSATNATYVLQAGDVASTIRVRVTASNGAGAGSGATSSQTAVVTAPVTPPAVLPSTVHGWGDRDPSGATTGFYGANGKRAAKYKAPDTRNIAALWVYEAGGGTTGAVNRRYFISDTDGANPANPTTTAVTCTAVSLAGGSAAAWRRIPLPSLFPWPADQEYYVGVQTDVASGDAEVQGHFLNGSSDRFLFASDTYSDGLAATFGTPSDIQARRIVFFFEGEVEEPPPPPEDLDPTLIGFGDRDPGGATAVTAGFNGKRASLYTSDVARSITSLWVYQGGVGTSGTVNRRFFIATSDGGSPANPTTTLVTCSPVAMTAPTAIGWREIPLPAPFAWAAATSYFVGYQTDGGSGDAVVEHYSNTGGRFAFLADTYSDGLASPFGTPSSTSDMKMVIFFEGDPSGGGGNNAVSAPVTDVGKNTATLHGVVNPGGVASVGFFQYGLTGSFELGDTQHQAIGSGSAGIQISAVLTGLLPGRTYHSRVVRDNA